MTLGNKIKQLRKSKGLSQLELANLLHLSSQAISKWESDLSFPEISLLPSIASLFGVTIDDLFEYSKEQEYDRIDHMIEYQRFLTNDEFIHAEHFLLNEIENKIDHHRALSTLADLYHFQATRLDLKAAHYAKMALRLKPNNKFDINTLHNSMHGVINDWNIKNHQKLNQQYMQLLREEPQSSHLYFYLLANLIDDGCLNEAKSILKQAKQVSSDSLLLIYDLKILELELGYPAVKEQFEALAHNHPTDWKILFEVANLLAQHEDYQKAIFYYQQAFHHEPSPRYTDSLEAIAQLHLLLGNKQEAKATYQREIQLLKEEWNMKAGDSIDQLHKKIKYLEEKNHDERSI